MSAVPVQLYLRALFVRTSAVQRHATSTGQVVLLEALAVNSLLSEDITGRKEELADKESVRLF